MLLFLPVSPEPWDNEELVTIVAWIMVQEKDLKAWMDADESLEAKEPLKKAPTKGAFESFCHNKNPSEQEINNALSFASHCFCLLVAWLKKLARVLSTKQEYIPRKTKFFPHTQP